MKLITEFYLKILSLSLSLFFLLLLLLLLLLLFLSFFLSFFFSVNFHHGNSLMEFLFDDFCLFVRQAIVATGTNLQLVFGPGTWGFNSDASRDCDFDKEPGKVRWHSII